MPSFYYMLQQFPKILGLLPQLITFISNVQNSDKEIYINNTFILYMKSQINESKQHFITSKFKNYTMMDERLTKGQQQLIETLQQKIKKRKQYRQLVAGSPTGFDITQFFDFKKKDKQSDSLIDQLAGGHWAWLILMYCMLNNSLVLPWMMVIDADKFLRLAWRHMFLNLVLVPFILYEKRIAKQQTKTIYQLKNMFKPEGLLNAFIVSLSKAFWFIIITTTWQFTTVAHTLILGNLMNFFLSINRFLNKSYHFLEPGGQIFVIIGVVLILKDQILMDTENIDTSYHMISFTNYSWHFRVSLDAIALFVSFIMALSYKYSTNLNKNYPSYLGMFIVNFMIAIILFFAFYFFHGASFDNDENYGIFGVFSGFHFTNFFQMSVLIGFGMLWSYAMISNLFPDPLLPSLAALFEPIISFMIMDLIGLQHMPSGHTVMGYIFIIPGTFLILIGQNIYQKIKKKQQKQLESRIMSIFEMSRTKKQTHHDLQSPLLFTILKKSRSVLRQNDYKQMDEFKQQSNKQNKQPFRMLSLKQISCLQNNKDGQK